LKILILKPSSLGDVIHALPVLRLLRLHLPSSEIFWWLSTHLTPLLENDADLNGIIPFDRKRWSAFYRSPEVWASIRAIRQRRFDWVIDLQGLARSGILAWLANAQLSIGLDNPREGAREGARGFYDQITPRSPQGTHAVDRYLSILRPLGVPVHRHFRWLPDRPEIAARIREQAESYPVRWIALVPGARWDNKRWPVEYFVTLTRRLLQSFPDLNLVVIGSAEDRSLASMIAKGDPRRCFDMTGRTSLPEMIEWIRLCRLVITNDTGPMHVAAALGKPTVAIFGPTDPVATGPYRQMDNLIQTRDLSCVPCLKSTCDHVKPLACLHAITPDMVFQAVRKRLMETSSDV
jgi:heptosyltransferase-1